MTVMRYQETHIASRLTRIKSVREQRVAAVEHIRTALGSDIDTEQILTSDGPLFYIVTRPPGTCAR